MDALSHVLFFKTPTGKIDKNCTLSRGWQLHHAAGEMLTVRWHAVLDGKARLHMPGGESLILAPGAIVLLPHHSPHLLSQSDTASTHLLCGSICLDFSLRFLIQALPDILYLSPADGNSNHKWLNDALTFIALESGNGISGSEALCAHICSAMFILAVREWLMSVPEQDGIFRTLVHPRLGSAIKNMLSTPAHPWTIEELARSAHMSRTSFAQNFKAVAGISPHALLTTLRLQLASQLISRGNSAIQSIARDVGFASESSFHKAFVRLFSCTPGEYRKRVKLLSGEGQQADI